MDEKKMEYSRQLEREKNWVEAADQYVQLLSEDSSSSLYERAAWCLSRAGKYSDSIKYLEKLHEIEPLSAKWPYMIGYQYYCQKDWNKSIEWFEKSLERYQDYFVVKYRLAYAYIQIASNYKKLTKAEYWKALGHLKDCHRLWKTFDENKKQRERGVYSDINFLHGKILMELPNHRDEAINCFLKALEINPTNEFAKYNLAKTYYLNGDFKKAKENIPTCTQYYVVELSAYTDAKLGDYPSAISAITKLLNRRKKDYLFRFLASTYLLSDNLEKAYKMAQKAVSIGQNNHKNYYILSKVFYQYGLLNKAIENLDKASKIKKTKYETAYEECDELREIILSKMSSDYHDDYILLEKLNKLTTSQFEQGTICRYNSEKGFGFIKGCPKDIFFHVSNCKYKGVTEGDFVQYRSITTDRGIMAVDLRKLR